MTRPTQLNRGLVGAWCPSLGNTGLVEYDRSVRKNRGALTSMTAASARVKSGGKGALEFPGTNGSWVQLGSMGSVTAPFAISVWVRFQTTAASYGTIFAGRATYADAFSIRQNGGSVIFGDLNGTFLDVSLAASITGLWTHICAVANTTSSATMFINGNQAGSATGLSTLGGTWSAPRIGELQPSFNRPFNGGLDDLRIYNRAPTAPEIRQLYVGGRGFGLLPERPRRRGTAAAAAFNRRRRVLLTAG